MELHGFYNLASNIPPFVVGMALVLICILVLLPIRERLEGLGYNNSYSSQLGDWFLAMAIEIGRYTLVDIGRTLPFLNSTISQLIVGVGAILVGISWQCIVTRKGPTTFTDAYHNVIIVPIFVGLATLLLPIAFWYGSVSEKTWVSACLLIWVILVIYDACTGRLDQSKYLVENGIKWKKRGRKK